MPIHSKFRNVLLAGAIIACCCGFVLPKLYYKTDLERNHLQGRVKFLAEVDYSVSGNPRLKVKPGDIEYADTFWYNKKGDITEERRHSYVVIRDSEVAFITLYNYTYDNTGKRVAVTYTVKGSTPSTDSFLYDSYRRDTMVIDYNSNGKVASVTSKQFDSLGRIIKISKNYIDHPKLNIITTIEYEDFRHTSITKTLHAKGHASYNIETYDGKGNIIESSISASKISGPIKQIMTYDDYGNELTRCEVRDSDNLSFCDRYSYDYDDHHNWIKSSVGTSDNKTELRIRTILYY